MKKKNSPFEAISKFLFALLMLTAITLTGCNKDEETVAVTESKPAPELPPQNSFAINFDDFDDTTAAVLKSDLTIQHWFRAAVHVLVWNARINVTLLIPVLAFYESFNHQGVYDPDTDSWIWSYNFIAGGVLHLAQLHASLVPDGVQWEMYISKNNAYSQFLWFSGISAFDNSEGHWHLYMSPQNPTDFLTIDWTRDNAGGMADMKYTYIVPEDPGFGSYIFYGLDTNQELDAFYNIFGAADTSLVDIQWSRINKDGRISDEKFFGDADWRCWDEMLQDIVCP